MQPFFSRAVMVVRASLEFGSFVTSFTRMLESRTSLGVLGPP